MVNSLWSQKIERPHADRSVSSAAVRSLLAKRCLEGKAHSKRGVRRSVPQKAFSLHPFLRAALCGATRAIPLSTFHMVHQPTFRGLICYFHLLRAALLLTHPHLAGCLQSACPASEWQMHLLHGVKLTVRIKFLIIGSSRA